MKRYYEAYDDRYCQVHKQHLQWASDVHSPIVAQVMARYAVAKDAPILELGCGEGRDARFLLSRGCNLTATDISSEAIRYCRERNPEYADRFRVLDCVEGEWQGKFTYIYAVAVIHMLVEDGDRAGFLRFIREHLTADGIALICTMGDGTIQRKSDISTAFEVQERTHDQSGMKLLLAGTSCCMVTWDSFLKEITQNGLETLEHGLTAVEPDFPVMMYAVVKIT